jgi:surface polysaccharide O-acyltransferase-like enzyme
MSEIKTRALETISETVSYPVEKEKKRIFFLDNLKIALVALVVANHAGQAYVTINTGWPVQDTNIPEINNYLLGTFFSFNSAFFMALFFLISAYFLPASLDRKGTRKYITDRLIRLGLPTLFFLVLVFPLFGYVTDGDGQSFTGFLQNSYFNFTDGLFTFGHTWFLGMLLIFSCFYACYRLLKPADGGKKKLLKAPGNVTILGFAVLLTLALFAIRTTSAPGNFEVWHLFEPARLPAYIAMFWVGILAYRNGWMKAIPVSTAKVWALVAIVTVLATPVVITLFGNGQDLWAEGFTVASLATSAWDAFLCVSLCVCLPVLFREKFDFRGKVLKAAADDAFVVYLIHPFVLVPLQGILMWTDIPALVKFVLVSAGGIALSFTLAHLIRKIPYFARVV